MEEASWFMRSSHNVNIFSVGFSVIQCHTKLGHLQSERGFVAHRTQNGVCMRSQVEGAIPCQLATQNDWDTINISTGIFLNYSFKWKLCEIHKLELKQQKVLKPSSSRRSLYLKSSDRIQEEIVILFLVNILASLGLPTKGKLMNSLMAVETISFWQ